MTLSSNIFSSMLRILDLRRSFGEFLPSVRECPSEQKCPAIRQCRTEYEFRGIFFEELGTSAVGRMLDTGQPGHEMKMAQGEALIWKCRGMEDLVS